MKLFGKSNSQPPASNARLHSDTRLQPGARRWKKLLFLVTLTGLVVSIVYTIDTTTNKTFYGSPDDSFSDSFKDSLKDSFSNSFKDYLNDSYIKKNDQIQISIRQPTGKSSQNNEAQNDDKLEIPTAFNADVPFTSQAPLAIWDERDEEACEEAALLMAAHYFGKSKVKSQKSKLDPAEVDRELNQIIAWEKQNLGEWKSTTAQQTAKIAQDYYRLKAEVKDYNLDEIKRALSQNQLVILPAAGRRLDNPYFKQPGPLYHMLLIKGYTKDNKIITNDPGTKRGANYQYDPKVLESAVGDWSNGKPDQGQKLMIIINK